MVKWHESLWSAVCTSPSSVTSEALACPHHLLNCGGLLSLSLYQTRKKAGNSLTLICISLLAKAMLFSTSFIPPFLSDRDTLVSIHFICGCFCQWPLAWVQFCKLGSIQADMWKEHAVGKPLLVIICGLSNLLTSPTTSVWVVHHWFGNGCRRVGLQL